MHGRLGHMSALGRAGLAVALVFVFALGIELLSTSLKRRVKA
jgi:hypothetical protein